VDGRTTHSSPHRSLVATAGVVAVCLVAAQGLVLAGRGGQAGISAGEVTAQSVRYPSGSATIEAFLARPSGPSTRKLPAVIVVHDDQGLNDAMRETTRLFASSGYVALAPSLTSRSGAAARGAASGGQPAAPPGGRGSVTAGLLPSQTAADVRAAFAYLQKDAQVDASKISVVGFGWGGWRAFKLAEQVPSLHRAVIFYGTTTDDEQLQKIRAPILGHYAEYDFRTTANALATKRRLADRFTYYIYPDTDRGFFGGSSGAIDYVALIRDRPAEALPPAIGDQAANAAAQTAAKQAWDRTLAFLRAN
jgi:carboxymethylenebutenolidase